MLMYGWMKFVELAPERYDWSVAVMTAGRLDKLKQRAASFVQPGDHVLDVGCGTGTMALRCLRKGATVVGLDISAYMLEVAKAKATKEGYEGKLTLIKDSVTQLRKHASPNTFDCIICTMVLGEFSNEYLDYIFSECRELLRPGGKLIIADEVWPTNDITRAAYTVMLGLAWIPQFLLLRRVAYPVTGLKDRITSSGFKITTDEQSFLTVFAFIVGTKLQEPSFVPGSSVGTNLVQSGDRV